MTPQELLQKWQELRDGPTSTAGMQRIRLSVVSAVDVFAFVAWPSRRVGILIEAPGRLLNSGNFLPACRGVKMVAEVVASPVEKSVAQVLLEDERLLDIFAVLSADLVAAVVAPLDVASGLKACVDRLAMWQILFDRVPVDGLSSEQQRGLMGELLVLEELFLAHLDSLAAVDSWIGPNPANQDFVRGGTAVEVKTTIAKRPARLMIANEKQLDETTHTVLILAHIRLDESQTAGISLPILVTRLRARLVPDPLAAALFNDKLSACGYLDVHEARYTSTRWRAAPTEWHMVEGDFPRLTDANLPRGVGDIRYSITTDGFAEYDLTFQQVVDNLRAHDV